MPADSCSRTEERQISNQLLIINVIGFLLSGYAHYISVSKKTLPSYQALCDISESMSCSRVLTSEYSTGFGFMGSLLGESSIFNQSNSVLGMVAYAIFFLLSCSNNATLCKVHLIMSIMANIGSIYLAYILIVLQDFCLVCVCTYVVNAMNFLLINKKISCLSDVENEKVE